MYVIPSFTATLEYFTKQSIYENITNLPRKSFSKLDCFPRKAQTIVPFIDINIKV